MNIFVTGGSGFLGQRLIRRLVQESHSVTALSRSAASDQTLKSLGAGTLWGSLHDIGQWESRLSGRDVVIHCAAPVEFWGPWDKFYQDITLATKNLWIASAKMKIKRFVHISSEAVVFGSRPLLDIDETVPYAPKHNNHYAKAKKLAELEILNLNSDMTTIILRPAYIWGKGDRVPRHIAAKIKSGLFRWIDGGNCPIETSHVENVLRLFCWPVLKERTKEYISSPTMNPLHSGIALPEFWKRSTSSRRIKTCPKQRPCVWPQSANRYSRHLK